jgi:hypothetical protein
MAEGWVIHNMKCRVYSLIQNTWTKLLGQMGDTDKTCQS